MPKATMTFQQRAVEFAMTAPKSEVDTVLSIMRQIATTRSPTTAVVSERKKPGPAKGFRRQAQTTEPLDSVEVESADVTAG